MVDGKPAREYVATAAPTVHYLLRSVDGPVSGFVVDEYSEYDPLQYPDLDAGPGFEVRSWGWCARG